MLNKHNIDFLKLECGIRVFVSDTDVFYIFREDSDTIRCITTEKSNPVYQELNDTRLITPDMLADCLFSDSFKEIQLSDVLFTGDRETMFRLESFLMDLYIDKAIRADSQVEKLNAWLEARQARNLESDLLKRTISLLSKISQSMPKDLYEIEIFEEIVYIHNKLNRWQNNRINKKLSKKGLNLPIKMLHQIIENKTKFERNGSL